MINDTKLQKVLTIKKFRYSKSAPGLINRLGKWLYIFLVNKQNINIQRLCYKEYTTHQH